MGLEPHAEGVRSPLQRGPYVGQQTLEPIGIEVREDVAGHSQGHLRAREVDFGWVVDGERDGRQLGVDGAPAPGSS